MVVSSRSFKAWIFSIFLLLLLVASETDASSSDSCGEAASGYASTNPGCALSGNCTQLSCSGLAGGKDVQMTVYNCEDPVRVVLDLQGSGQHCNRTYLVSGYNSYDEISLGNMVLHASHSRNTSHLLFLAYMGSFPSGNIVPPVTIPLALDVCMYEDFEDAAQSFSLPSFLTYACAAETNVCGGFQCNFTGGGESYSTCVSVEPCNETLQVTIWDSGDNVQYDEIFNTNKTVNLTPSAGPNFSLRVHLHHYNYSMEVQLTVVIEGDIAAELLPHQRLILDRSECSPLITYPDPSPMLCSAPSSAGGCGNLQASYASSHAGCSLASDCLMAKCSLPDNSNATLVVFNCEDPVRVVLSVSQSAGQCSRTYSVSGSETTVQDDLLGSLHITSIYSRNASHVQFMVLYGKGSFFIPPLILPLLPGKCMFRDFVNTSKNVVLPSPIVYSCKAETKMCGGILCNVTVPYQVGISEVYETCITIDPCQESIQIVIRDSLDNSVFDELFNQTRSIFIQPQQGQPFTLHVILFHYNYSMEAKVTVNIQLQNLPFPVDDLVILPRQRFILDRTKCVPFISFPAAPPTVDPSPMLCSAPSSAGPHPVTMATPTSLPTFPSPGGCGNLQASYASAHAGCSLASDCLMAKCSLPDNSNAMLVVFNCEDPVRVVLSVSQSAGQCSRTYSVSGSETTVQDDLLGSLHITSIYSRNASHVQFMVSSGKGSFAIPPVTLPLLPGKCMFGDFVNTSKNVVLPSSIVYSCKAETKMCGGILCNFTVPYQVGISEVYETCITIDPCQESIQIVIRDSLDNSVFDELFNQTRSIFIQPQQAQPFTLRVILVHYNYSMEAKVTVNVQLQNFPFPVKDLVILPRQRFILDRTKCVPFISFPAAPDKWSTLMDCHPYATTPKASGSHSHIAVAILVPVALVLVAIVTAITLVTVFLVHRWRKKRADVGFQRITFNDVDFEDSEDDEN